MQQQFNLDNIIANDLGQTTKQINHLSQKAGSTTSLTTTIRQFSNALISSDKIHISGFTSDYVFNEEEDNEEMRKVLELLY